MKTEHEELVEIVNRGRWNYIHGGDYRVEQRCVLFLTAEQFDRLNKITMWGRYDPRDQTKAEQ